MKKILFFCLSAAIFSSSSIHAEGGDLNQVKADQEDLWAGTGAPDATTSAISLSMLGWGIGLAGGIALLASAINQSSSSHDSSSSSH